MRIGAGREPGSSRVGSLQPSSWIIQYRGPGDGPLLARASQLPGSVRPPTDSAAAMICAWLFAHGAPRTAEVLRRLQRHAWAIEPPDPDAATQTEL